MKLTIDSTTLTEAALFAARAVNTRHSTPVLTGIKLTADNGTLTLTGFDGDKSARITVSADVAEPGEYLLPAGQLTTILKVIPNNKPLALEVVDDRATLKSGKTKFTVPTMRDVLYPQLPAEPETIGTIDSDVFTRGVALVILSASKENALQELQGIKVEARGNVLSFLATDRYRMSYADLPWNPAPGMENVEFLVHASTLDGAAKASAGQLTLQLSDGRAGFVSGNRSTASNLMAGNYPAVRKMFGAGEIAQCVAPTADLLASVSRASVVIDGKNPVTLTFDPQEVTLNAGTGEASTGSESVEAALTGEEDHRVVGFNPYYLMDALKVLGTENVVIGFRENPGHPVSFQPEGWDAPDAQISTRTILMPIRL